MIDTVKLARGFTKLLTEVKSLREEVGRIPTRQPKDGVSPKAEDIAALVLEQIPAPKDGVSPKAEDIAALVLEQIPAPKDGVSPKAEDIAALVPRAKDGVSPTAEAVAALIPRPRDGISPRVEDVAALVLPKIPVPKDGVSPTAEAVAAKLLPQMPKPKDGENGADGKGITRVKLEKNTLFVWLDGVKKSVGKIEMPRMTPSGGSVSTRIVEKPAAAVTAFATMAITQRDETDADPNEFAVTAHPDGTDVLNPPADPVAVGDGPFNGYVKVPGYVQDGTAKNVTVSDSSFTIERAGEYIVPVGWGGFRHSENNATVGFVLAVERDGLLSFSQRPTAGLKPNLGRLGNISGGGKVTAQAGDKLSVWVASDTAGDITLSNSNVTIHAIEITD